MDMRDVAPTRRSPGLSPPAAEGRDRLSQGRFLTDPAWGSGFDRRTPGDLLERIGETLGQIKNGYVVDLRCGFGGRPLRRDVRLTPPPGGPQVGEAVTDAVSGTCEKDRSGP
jgi:hypothetical protein